MKPGKLQHHIFEAGKVNLSLICAAVKAIKHLMSAVLFSNTCPALIFHLQLKASSPLSALFTAAVKPFRRLLETTGQPCGCLLSFSPLFEPQCKKRKGGEKKNSVCSVICLNEPIYTSVSVPQEESQGLSGPRSLGFKNSSHPEAVLGIMGPGSTHQKQFILLIDFTSLLIVFILQPAAFPYFSACICLALLDLLSNLLL